MAPLLSFLSLSSSQSFWCTTSHQTRSAAGLFCTCFLLLLVAPAAVTAGASTCAELKAAGTATDGEYILTVGGAEVSVYCYHMGEADQEAKACTCVVAFSSLLSPTPTRTPHHTLTINSPAHRHRYPPCGCIPLPSRPNWAISFPRNVCLFSADSGPWLRAWLPRKTSV